MAYVQHRVPCCRVTWEQKHLKNENDSQESRLIITYNIGNANNPTLLYSGSSIGIFDEIEIDGTKISVADIDTADGRYLLSSGEHTIAYTLKDPTLIEDRAFYGCSSLSSVTIPNSITTIGYSAFENCTGLNSITITSKVTSIGNSAFNNCNSLDYVYISDLSAWCRISFSNNASNPLYYSKHLYLNNEEITNLIIPSDITLIKDYTFINGNGFTSITIHNNVTSIGRSSFLQCNGFTSIIIPNSITSIGTSAFSDCSGLTSIVIPDGITTIKNATFSSCINIVSVTIPDSVTSIEDGVFTNCYDLSSITIPSHVTSIGNGVFYNCSNLKSIISSATTAPTIQSSTFSNIGSSGTLYTPLGSTGYDAWMSTDNNYLGKYNWIKIEQ